MQGNRSNSRVDLSWQFAKCFVFFYVIISHVWPQEKTQRLKKAKFIILTGPRETVTTGQEGVIWEALPREWAYPSRWGQVGSRE